MSYFSKNSSFSNSKFACDTSTVYSNRQKLAAERRAANVERRAKEMLEALDDINFVNENFDTEQQLTAAYYALEDALKK